MVGDDAPSAKQIDSMLQRLEKRIETLKKRYRRYFLGIETRPPTQMRKQVVREIFELEQTFISNTAQKFKLRSLVQSFNTNKTRWNRVMRQIEEGTYKRDRHKAKRRQREREQQEQQRDSQQAFELDEDDFIGDLHEIDLEAVFAAPSGKEPTMTAGPEAGPGRGSSASPPSSPQRPRPQPSGAERERIKQQRLAEIQRQLGLGAGGGGGSPTAAPKPRQGRALHQGGASQGRSGAEQRESARQQPSAGRRRKIDRNQRSISRSGAARSGAGQGRSQTEQRPSTRGAIDRRVQRKDKRPSPSSTPTGSPRRVVRRTTSTAPRAQQSDDS